MVKQKTYEPLAKLLYGALFVLVFPALLAIWSYLLESTLRWSVPEASYLPAALFLIGGSMTLLGMVDLYRFGHGLPMNAFPPEALVTNGIYAWLANPIYVGSVLLWLAVSLWIGSAAGLYIGTPLLALMAISLLFGYERLAMEKQFGEATTNYQPLFAWPSADREQTTMKKKVAMLLRIIVPWLLALSFITYAQLGTWHAFSSRWQFAFYLSWLMPYFFLFIKLLLTQTNQALLQWTIRGSVAACLGLYVHLLFPERLVDFVPSAIYLLLMHLVVVCMAINYRPIWFGLMQWTESVANGRRDWLLANGRFRIISHACYSALSGIIAMAISTYILGKPLAALLFGICALGGAALFARILWGSPALVRPFGYWGGILGSLIGTLLLTTLWDIPLASVALVAVLSAPFAQAAGRLRCLSQGCCHGTVTQNQSVAIRVWQPQSRIVMLSGLEGEYLLNTQLISILFNLFLGVLLWQMTFAFNLNVTLIIGLYFVLTGIERFAEDAYRGEKQTRSGGALLENQWIAIAALFFGMSVAAIPSSTAPRPEGTLDLIFLLAMFAGGLVAAFALSMDFPKSRVSFSRLSG